MAEWSIARDCKSRGRKACEGSNPSLSTVRIERENNKDTATVVEHMFPGVKLSDLPFADPSCIRATIRSINYGGLVTLFSEFRYAIHNGESHTERQYFGDTLDRFWAGYRMLAIEPPYGVVDHRFIFNNTSFVEFLESGESLAGIGRMKVSMSKEPDAYISVIGVMKNNKTPTGLIYHVSGTRVVEMEKEVVRGITPVFNM